MFCREILLLVNLCVALANAYITPLPAPPEESNAETTSAAQQAAAAPPKKGAKVDQQAPAANSAPTSSLPAGIKNEDVKSALEVKDLMKNIMNIFICTFFPIKVL